MNATQNPLLDSENTSTFDFLAHLSQIEIQALERYNSGNFKIEDEEKERIRNRKYYDSNIIKY